MAVQDGSPLILDPLWEEIRSQRKGNATARNREPIGQKHFSKGVFLTKNHFSKSVFYVNIRFSKSVFLYLYSEQI